MENKEVQALEKELNSLRERVEELRFSRRVLMNLVINMEKEKQKELMQLAKEKDKLLKNNRKYAKELFDKKCQLTLLERTK